MKRAVLYIVFFCFLIIFNTCKTDFEVNAPWKDITIVYGLLEQTFSPAPERKSLPKTQYIRINKAFLGDGNALIMAKSFDSTNYKKGDLLVELEEYNNNTFITKYELEWAMVDKSDGEFYDPNNPKQTVYKNDITLNDNNHYKLVVTNRNTGKIITSETDIVKDFTFRKPQQSSEIGLQGTKDLEWVLAKNGKAYQLQIRFNYLEIVINTNQKTPKHLDWVLPTIYSSNNDPEKRTFNADNFYQVIVSNIPVNPDVKRVIGKVDFMLLAAAADLFTYIEVNKPSNSVVQEKPEWTNISNGLGLFSSRFTNTRTFNLNEDTKNLLMFGEQTKKLGFVKNEKDPPPVY